MPPFTELVIQGLNEMIYVESKAIEDA